MTENVRRGSVILIITQRTFHILASLDPMGTFATLALLLARHLPHVPRLKLNISGRLFSGSMTLT